jgi:hypothetical protein
VDKLGTNQRWFYALEMSTVYTQAKEWGSGRVSRTGTAT